jgi:hypothetical protein
MIYAEPGSSKEKREELITSNLTINALDRYMSRGEKKYLSWLIILLIAYFKHLFKESFYEEHIKNTKPLRLHCPEDDKTFIETFKETYLYVTHFIKIHNYSVLSIDFLMRPAIRRLELFATIIKLGLTLFFQQFTKTSPCRRTTWLSS